MPIKIYGSVKFSKGTQTKNTWPVFFFFFLFLSLTSLIVIEGFQPAARIERHTAPEEKMLGWNSGGEKEHFGGETG